MCRTCDFCNRNNIYGKWLWQARNLNSTKLELDGRRMQNEILYNYCGNMPIIYNVMQRGEREEINKKQKNGHACGVCLRRHYHSCYSTRNTIRIYLLELIITVLQTSKSCIFSLFSPLSLCLPLPPSLSAPLLSLSFSRTLCSRFYSN